MTPLSGKVLVGQVPGPEHRDEDYARCDRPAAVRTDEVSVSWSRTTHEGVRSGALSS
jgi:hypothetical protein